MQENKVQPGLVIIGGGAAGMMAAITAKKTNPQLEVMILDRTFALGRKILVCGAGRCNVTNINLEKGTEGHYYGANTEFINSVFNQLKFEGIVEFFRDLGIELYVERKTDIGKLFPVTDQAKTVTALLEDELARLGINIHLNTEVEKIEKTSLDGRETFLITARKIEQNDSRQKGVLHLPATKVIIAAGGMTYPALGSNGSGYSLAESFGHRIITPVPSALPLESKNPLSHYLQGVKLEVEVSSFIEGRLVKTRTDEVMFTKYGVSGPAVLNVSREISIHIHREQKRNAELQLNFFPGKNAEEVGQLLRSRWEKRPGQTVEKSLFGIFPNKVPAALLAVININPTLAVAQLSSGQKEQIISLLTNYKLPISNTRGWNEAEFTAGGVETNQVDSGSLESKLQHGLYFCGEILDVDGDVGGFNLSWAWASGFVAGKNAASST